MQTCHCDKGGDKAKANLSFRAMAMWYTEANFGIKKMFLMRLYLT